MRIIMVGCVLCAGCGGGAFSAGAASDSGPDPDVEIAVAGDSGPPGDGGVHATVTSASDSGLEARVWEGDSGSEPADGQLLDAASKDANAQASSADSGLEACALVTHTSGMGSSWQDCAPLGTYTEDEALAACASYTGNVSDCGDRSSGCVMTCGAELSVCTVGYPDASVRPTYWQYTGPRAGAVSAPSALCSPTGSWR